MEILVCIKQVLTALDVKINPETNTLVRQSADCAVNPYDLQALLLAVRLKEECGGNIYVLSMGPENAEMALRECLLKGADEAFLLSDGVFAGADTLATSYTLAQGIKKIAADKKIPMFDLVLCGKNSADSDTAQVGPQLAEWLALPQVTYAEDVKRAGGGLRVRRKLTRKIEIAEVEMPCLVTVGDTGLEPYYGTIRRKIASLEAKIKILSVSDIPGFDRNKAGLSGSPTRTKEIYLLQKKSGGQRISGSASEMVERVFEILQDSNAL